MIIVDKRTPKKKGIILKDIKEGEFFISKDLDEWFGYQPGSEPQLYLKLRDSSNLWDMNFLRFSDKHLCTLDNYKSNDFYEDALEAECELVKVDKIEFGSKF